MKVGITTKTNQKGQVVIPKSIRDELSLDENSLLSVVLRGGGIYLYPVKDVVPDIATENSYIKILEKTKGTWNGEDWNKVRKNRENIELASSEKRKKQW